MTTLEEREPELARLSDADLGSLQAQAAEIGAAAPGVDEVFEAIRDGVADEKQSRSNAGHSEFRLPERLAATPDAVVEDQREAMVRAIRLRNDERLSDPVRGVWAAVVQLLARLRRDAKDALATRRRDSDPFDSGWLATEGASQRSARLHEVLTSVPTETEEALPHLDSKDGGDRLGGRPEPGTRPERGASDDPTITPHSRA